MKIVVTSQGPNLDSPVDPRFGRCQYFILVDPETMEFSAHENPAQAAPGGAGIEAAQFVASLGATHVLTGNVGPNAYPVLQAAGIQVITGVQGTVRDAVNAFKQGIYQAAPNVPPTFPGFTPGFTIQPGAQDLQALKNRLLKLKEEIDNLLERIKKLEEKGK